MGVVSSSGYFCGGESRCRNDVLICRQRDLLTAAQQYLSISNGSIVEMGLSCTNHHRSLFFCNSCLLNNEIDGDYEQPRQSAVRQ